MYKRKRKNKKCGKYIHLVDIIFSTQYNGRNSNDGRKGHR
jgi:hypothetical protein